MSASVEITEGLERRVRHMIPASQIAQAIENKLKEIAPKVQLNGFRAGKIPPERVIRQRFGNQARDEVIDELIRKTLFEILKDQNIEPVTQPEIAIVKGGVLLNDELVYEATFEVSPTFEFDQLPQLKIEKAIVTISDSDIDKMLEQLRKQRTHWQVVDRKAMLNDQVTIDFVGSLDGVPFKGGEAKGFKLEIGGKRMIPGFEEGLIGVTKGDDVKLKVTFPENYHANELAGKAVVFDVHVHEVAEPQLPELDEKFAEALGVKEGSGSVAELRKQVHTRLEQELSQNLKQRSYNDLVNKLQVSYSVGLPKRLLQQEIHAIQHEADQHGEHRGHDAHHDHAEPSLEMEQRARQRVTLQLLFAAYIKKNNLHLDQERVRNQLMRMAENYEHPEEMLRWYYKQENLLNAIRARVFEEQVMDHILEHVQWVEKVYSYEEVLRQS